MIFFNSHCAIRRASDSERRILSDRDIGDGSDS
jgi:hypothetical protein